MSEMIELVSEAVVRELADRSGFDGWWISIDQITQEEIRQAIGRAVLEAIDNHMEERAEEFRRILDEAAAHGPTEKLKELFRTYREWEVRRVSDGNPEGREREAGSVAQR